MTTTTTAAANNINAISISLLLSIVCLGIVFVGDWYFQSSIDELRTLVDDQQDTIMELKKEIAEYTYETPGHTTKTTQEETIQQLKDHNVRSMTNDNVTAGYNVEKRSTTSPPQTKNLEILRGRDGRDGRDGLPGPRGVVGPPGPKGDTGVPGPKGDRAGGVVYVRWGHNTCPDGGAQLVYAGRAGGSYYNHKGGGGNPQCLPLDPKFYKTVSGAQSWAFMYGAEYQDTNGLVANSHDTDVPCAVCYVPTRNALYMIPAKYECPSGWTREYFGYLMSEHHNHHRSQFSCVDHSLTSVIGSSHNHNGFLFYTIEGVCGSLPCPPYSRDKELSCAVCTK